MELSAEYKTLMASLERMEKMNLAKPGGPTGQLKALLAEHTKNMEECENHIIYLRNELDVTKAKLEVAENKIASYVSKYGQLVIRTYSRKK